MCSIIDRNVVMWRMTVHYFVRMYFVDICCGSF